jgi:hypothetical protein
MVEESRSDSPSSAEELQCAVSFVSLFWHLLLLQGSSFAKISAFIEAQQPLSAIKYGLSMSYSKRSDRQLRFLCRRSKIERELLPVREAEFSPRTSPNTPQDL